MIEEHNLTERARDVLFYAKHYSSPDKPRPVKTEDILLLLLVDPKLFEGLLTTESNEVMTGLRDDLKAFDRPVHKSWHVTEPPPLFSAARQVNTLATRES